LTDTGLEARYLELEITESVAMQYATFTITMLRELKAMGIQTSIDDFGTGYSSLSSFNRFAFDTLKIDQAFVRSLTDTDGGAIVNTLITLGKSLHRRVIAEGVETREQFEMLRDRGCDEVQGYYFSRPVPADEVAELLAKGGRISPQK
jgi:EAL domain-containing protein (putative c-di-GMP-specific phosphodiesterase class I)